LFPKTIGTQSWVTETIRLIVPRSMTCDRKGPAPERVQPVTWACKIMSTEWA